MDEQTNKSSVFVPFGQQSQENIRTIKFNNFNFVLRGIPNNKINN